MEQNLNHLCLLVKDYDEAINFYTQKLGFELIEDTVLGADKRWVLVKPRGSGSCSLLLAKAASEHQISHIGDQSGGRVFLFLYTDDFEKAYNNLLYHQVEIVRKPSEELYGQVAVFKDLYGNMWDLIELDMEESSLEI